MLQNAYFFAKIGADTAENERNFAELLPKAGNYPTGRRRCTRSRRASLDAAVRGARAELLRAVHALRALERG